MILKGKKVRLIVIVLAASLFMGSCAGRGDWDYDLINGYQLIKSSAHAIQLSCDYNLREHWDNSTTVLKRFYVKMIAISDPFVGLQGIPTQDRSASDEELNADRENYKYYLLDSSHHLLYGPYSEEAFYDKCTREGIMDLQDWISTEDINRVR